MHIYVLFGEMFPNTNYHYCSDRQQPEVFYFKQVWLVTAPFFKI